MTIQEMMDMLRGLYGQRNKAFMPSILERIAYFAIAVRDVQQVVRKHSEDRRLLYIACARCIARLVVCAEYFDGQLPFNEMLCRKFPRDHCSYCRKLPCQCKPEDRRSSRLARSAAADMLGWSLNDWCLHLDVLYGQQNKARGIHNILDRLNAEVAEFLSLSLQLPHEHRRSAARIRQEFALELADIFCWTLAVANFYHLNLEQELQEYCGFRCRVCGQNPCQCLSFDFSPKDWTNV